MNSLSRRGFLASAGAAAAAAAIGARQATAAPRIVPSGRRIRLAYIGCGTQGFRQLTAALENPDLEVVAVCDPVRRSDEYIDYGGDELNNRMRKFLNDSGWAKGARGALCGREPGREIVDRHYARAGGGSPCRAYADVRELLQKEQELDAVYIMTPDHLHGVIAIMALRQGRHVITHKPISNVLQEVRMARDLARESGLVAQLFCAAGQGSTPMLREWLDAGAIGPVREVHNWSTRPFWPQGMTEFPVDTPPVPDGFDWDLWLGPAAERPYHPAYTHSVFRGWYDFGTGALGDMGHYSFHQIFELLDLGSPLAVEASRSQVWKIEGYRWRRQDRHVAYPHAAQIRWDFAARGDRPPVALHWYDGGIRPPTIPELEQDGVDMPDEGMLLVGERGKILAGFTGDSPRLLPDARMKDFQPPPATRPRPIGELEQFVRACRGGPMPDASFEQAYPFAETILLGTIALRVNKKLKWAAERAEFANSKSANDLLVRCNRAGWIV